MEIIDKYIEDYNKYIFRPSDLVINNVNRILRENKLEIDNYISVHIRCGDYSMNKINKNRDYRMDINNEEMYKKIDEYIKDKYKDKNLPIVIHTDSEKFKNKMKEIYKEYLYLDIDIIHTGIEKNNDYVSTISEFYIISNAKIISMPITYSGFSHWASVIGKKQLDIEDKRSEYICLY